MEIKIKYVTEGLEKIVKIPNGDWIDLRAAEDVTLKMGQFALISLGVAMKLPEGYEAHMAPRSSTFKHFGIIQTNSVGVIDSSFCGDDDIWKYPALAMRDTVIHKNDRICQFRIVKKQPDFAIKEVSMLGERNRGGFGSTGKNKISDSIASRKLLFKFFSKNKELITEIKDHIDTAMNDVQSGRLPSVSGDLDFSIMKNYVIHGGAEDVPIENPGYIFDISDMFFDKNAYYFTIGVCEQDENASKVMKELMNAYPAIKIERYQ